MRPAFKLSAIVGDQYPEMEVPSGAELLAQLRAGEISGEVIIYQASGDFPRATIDWHAEHGFVLFCLDSETSWGHFLTREEVTSRPSVQVVLGARRWSRGRRSSSCRIIWLRRRWTSSWRPAGGRETFDARWPRRICTRCSSSTGNS